MSTQNKINFIETFTGIRPDLEKMATVSAGAEKGKSPEEFEERLRKLFRKTFMEDDIAGVKRLERQFGRPFSVSEGELQVLYSAIIMAGPVKKELLQFLQERTGITPSQEIIRAKYRELLAAFDPESLGEFMETIRVRPPEELVQEKYRALFKTYLETEHPSYEDGGEGYHGEREYELYARFIATTGIQPQFSQSDARQWYEYCLSAGDFYFHKFGVILRETGVGMDENFIQSNILDNTSFSAAVPLTIADEMLDRHFADPRRRTPEEYQRIYQIFGCFDYYKYVLAGLEQQDTREAKLQRIGILAVMGLRDINDAERYAVSKSALLGYVGERSVTIRHALAGALSTFARSGDHDVLTYFASILRERTKTAKGKEQKETRGVLGLSPLQETALRTLACVNQPVANEQLLDLLFVQDLEPRVRYWILGHLVTERGRFFPPDMRVWAKAKQQEVKSAFPWEDLRYFRATLAIPNADMREKALGCMDKAFDDIVERGLSPSALHKTLCAAAPENAFLPIWKFVDGDQRLLEKFHRLYQKTKSSADSESLLLGVVNAMVCRRAVLDKVVQRLGGMEIVEAGGAAELGTILKTLGFLDTVERSLNKHRRDEDEDKTDETLTILDVPVVSLRQLNESLKEVVVRKIREVLPDERIDGDAIQALWQDWGGLEPIFIYAAKMGSSDQRGTLRLIAEMVANMDAPEYQHWKQWRYNVGEDQRAAEQVGHLSGEQLEIWKADYFAELGDIMIATSPSDKPKQIVKTLEISLGEGHIYQPQIHASDRHRPIQEKLGAVYAAIAERPQQRDEILRGTIARLQEDMGTLDAMIRFSGLSKLEQTMNAFAKGKKVPINAKTKNMLGAFSPFLPKERMQKMEKILREAEKSGTMSVDAELLLDAEGRAILTTKIVEIREANEENVRGRKFERFGFADDPQKEIGRLYQKRQEWKALLDLCRISALDAKKIATNRVSDRADKKGESLSSVMDGLKVYFKDNPAFVQDLENILSTLAQKESLGDKRRLAMIVTDHPQILIQVGKYPIGCGSCQNYEGGESWNRSLAGYIADAHSKAVFLIDLNRLSDGTRASIEREGFEKAKAGIPRQELLEASVARAMVKIVSFDDTSGPALFVEPTYSSINKGDLTMDNFFNVFLELMVSEPMRIRLVRGEGSETVCVPESRNPAGQYEDCAAGNAEHGGMGIQQGSYTMRARIIDKFSPMTEADRRLASRISGE